MTDLPTEAFLRLRDRFFDADGRPVPFRLRDKRNTQDDPFDEFLVTQVLSDLPGVSCVPAPSPLITPDLVLLRSDGPFDRGGDPHQIIGIEVKRIGRTKGGAVARASGVDFNTTPPCGRIRIYDANDSPLEVRGFYLFVCCETAGGLSGPIIVSSLALVDGDFLNEDFGLYLSVTGEREKRIGLGTFSDGADRERPMLIFPNPLGVPEFDRSATLVHSDLDRARFHPELRPEFRITRTVPSSGELRTFMGYRRESDATDGPTVELRDPFPTPVRTTRTRRRGRFTLPFSL